MIKDEFPKAKEADIALLMEGTYPLVSGGVSSWMHQIVSSFSQYTFAIIFLGSKAEDYHKVHFQIPDNVVHVEIHYLFEPSKSSKPKPYKMKDHTYDNMASLHDWFRCPNFDSFDMIKKFLRFYQEGENKVKYDEFLYSDGAWEYVCSQFEEHCSDPSFIDYFWTVRNMHAAIWTVGNIVEHIPKVKAFHTISTGYAGFLGALLKFHYNCPLILSEHGIYTKERRIDLIKGQWIQDNRSIFLKDNKATGYYKQLWIRFFESLAKICYDASDQIISLFGGCQKLQILGGANTERLAIIPNGIDIDKLKSLRNQRDAKNPPIVCLLGRVVPIKDIKNFIRAMRTVVNEVPEAEGWIVGPQDEDKAYSDECKELVEKMGLNDKVKFLGKQMITDIFPKVRLLVLSSISEGLPLSTLEGYAAGVPCVSTDVGACSELIFGRDKDDKEMGPSGDIVNIANPLALGKAISPFLKDDEKWQQAQEIAIKRVETFYDLQMMIDEYQIVYDKALT